MRIMRTDNKWNQFQRSYWKLPALYQRCFILISVISLIQIVYVTYRLILRRKRPWESVLETVCSNHTNSCFQVIDAQGTDGHIYRKMIVHGMEIDVESEIRLLRPAAIVPTKFWMIDYSWLTTEYLKWMLVWPLLINGVDISKAKEASTNYDYLFIGLGGGSLPTFIRRHIPEINITVIELEKIVKMLAVKWFDFVEDRKMRCLIADGIEFLQNGLTQFDAVILDACDPDTNAPISCPFHRFYHLDTIRNIFRSLKPFGVLVVNVLSRNDAMVDRVSKRYSQVFPNVFRQDMQTEQNAVLICLTYSFDNYNDYLTLFRQRIHLLNKQFNLNMSLFGLRNF